MVWWAEQATSTAEGKKILMVAIGAANSGEALVKIAAFQVFSDNMGNYRAEEAIVLRKEIVVTILEFINLYHRKKRKTKSKEVNSNCILSRSWYSLF
jgi:hypothetical protein